MVAFFILFLEKSPDLQAATDWMQYFFLKGAVQHQWKFPWFTGSDQMTAFFGASWKYALFINKFIFRIGKSHDLPLTLIFDLIQPDRWMT